VPAWLVKGTSRRNDSEWWMTHGFYMVLLYLGMSRYESKFKTLGSSNFSQFLGVQHPIRKSFDPGAPIAGAEEYNTPSMA
jgi:hypothetical protein